MTLENYGRNCFHMKNILLSKICLRFKIAVKVLLTPEAICSVVPEITAMTWCLALWPNISFKLQDYGWKSTLSIYASLSLTTNISCIFSIQFWSRVRTKQKKNIDLPSYGFMTKTRPFLWGGGGVGGEKNAPCLYPALYQTSRVLGMFTSELKNVTETFM